IKALVARMAARTSVHGQVLHTLSRPHRELVTTSTCADLSNMRIVFDISGSTKLSGGMRLHASQILATWTNEFPSDQIHVFGPQWVRTIEDADFSIHHWPNESIVHRATGQLLLSAVVARRVKADAVVSLSPIVT